MDDQKFAKYKTAFIVVAVLIALLEIPGALDIRNRPYSGYWTDPNDTVIRVFPNSPAERAGFLMGDHIISSGGIDMKDSKSLARRPRAKIGETRAFFASFYDGVSERKGLPGQKERDALALRAGRTGGFAFSFLDYFPA